MFDWWEKLSYIRVGPFRLSVEWMTRADKKKHKSVGAFFADECRIAISEELDPDCIRETLLHEVLHACVRVSGLDDADAEERVISAISPTLLEVLQRNPRLVRYLRLG